MVVLVSKRCIVDVVNAWLVHLSDHSKKDREKPRRQSLEPSFPEAFKFFSAAIESYYLTLPNWTIIILKCILALCISFVVRTFNLFSSCSPLSHSNWSFTFILISPLIWKILATYVSQIKAVTPQILNSYHLYAIVAKRSQCPKIWTSMLHWMINSTGAVKNLVWEDHLRRLSRMLS